MTTIPDSNTPYIGPRPFESGDRHLFFGRDREARDLVSLIVAQTEVVLYAASGAGKTSLINAQVVPQLKTRGRKILPIARVGSELVPEHIPGDVRNIFIFNVLLGWVGTNDRDLLRNMTLCEYLQNLERQIHESSQDSSEDNSDDDSGGDSTPKPRVLIFDQFEELFIFYEDRWPDRKDFFIQVREALDADPLLRVVFAIREDYVASLARFEQVMPQRMRTRFRLEPLRQEAALLAITGPLKHTDRKFDEGVAEKLVQDLSAIQVKRKTGPIQHAEGEFVEPVQLQVVCHSLWNRLPDNVKKITQTHVDQYGDVSKALGQFYNECIARVAVETGVSESRIREWFGSTLITSQQMRAVLFQESGRTGGMPNRVVDWLVQYHMIRQEPRAGGDLYELTHDRFIGPILESNNKWNRDRRSRVTRFAIAGAIIGVLVVLLLLIGFFVTESAESRHAEQTSVAQTAVARMGALVEGATRQSDPLQALALALEAGNTEFPSLQVQRLLAELGYPSVRYLFEDHERAVNSVAFSPDGRQALSGSSDGTLILWNLVTGEKDKVLRGHTSGVWSVAFSPDGTQAISGSSDKTMILWNVASGEPTHTFEGHAEAVYSVAFSPDGTKAISGSADQTLILWDVAKRTNVHTFKGHSSAVNCVAFSPDGTWVLSGSSDKTLILWNVATREHVRTFERHGAAVYSVAFSPDGTRALSGSSDGMLILWEITTGGILRTFVEHSGTVYSVAFSPDARYMLSGSNDATLILWDVATGKILRRFEKYSSGVKSVAFSPDGMQMLSGSLDSRVLLWDVPPGALLCALANGHIGAVTSVAFSPDGTRALSGSADNPIMLWDMTNCDLVRTFEGHSGTVYSVAFSPDGTRLLSGSLDKTLILWDVTTGEPIRTLTGHTGTVNSVAFSPDGTRLLSGSSDKTLILWDVTTGEPIHTLTGHTGTVNSVAFSPDGTHALSGSSDKTLILWDATTGEPIHTFEGHSAAVNSVAFSPDGTFALSGSSDQTLNVWNVATRAKERTLEGERKAPANSVALSLKSANLTLSGYGDSSVVVWDTATGTVLYVYEWHATSVRSIAFSPDGRKALSGSTDGVLLLWRVDALDDLKKWITENRYVPELSCENRAKYEIKPYCTPTPAE